MHTNRLHVATIHNVAPHHIRNLPRRRKQPRQRLTMLRHVRRVITNLTPLRPKQHAQRLTQRQRLTTLQHEVDNLVNAPDDTIKQHLQRPAPHEVTTWQITPYPILPHVREEIRIAAVLEQEANPLPGLNGVRQRGEIGEQPITQLVCVFAYNYHIIIRTWDSTQC